MTGQNQLAQAINTLKDVANHSSSTDKQRILKAGDNPYLREILFYTYNKYLTYRVKQIIDPDHYAEVQPDTMYEFKQLCENLAAHKWGTNEALDRVKKFLALNTVEGAEVFKNALLRDIRAGIDVKSVNKAFAGLVPTFNVMLADKVEDAGALSYPLVMEEKMDGCRTIAIYDGNTVTLYSREGQVFHDAGVIAKQIARIAPGFPAVYDGEIVAFTPDLQDKTCKKNIDGNWPFYYGLSLLKNESKTAEKVKDHLMFHVWDVIDYEYFISNGVRGKAEKLSERKIKLVALLERVAEDALPNVDMLPNWVAHNQTELLDKFRELRNKGAEGLMVKLDSVYEFKRSKNLLKLKEFFDADLAIVGAEEGNGKYEGLLGALHVSSACGKIKCKVGSGFTDEDRAELWVEYLAGRLTGKITTITYQEVTKDGSLRFPTFNHVRFDKTEADRF